jgi:hypothetical protein
MARFLGSSIFEITVIPPTKKISESSSSGIHRNTDDGVQLLGRGASATGLGRIIYTKRPNERDASDSCLENAPRRVEVRTLS